MRHLKTIVFTCFAIVILVLCLTSLLDVITGLEGLSEFVYASRPFAALWVLLALLSLSYLIWSRIWRAPATALIHLSFLVILSGALTTYLTGRRGTMHIRQERPAFGFETREGEYVRLPFEARLDTFGISYYPGTAAPADFTTRMEITDGGRKYTGQVSMNKILSYRHYRFYQAGYDADMRGSTLSVAHDPWGIAISYTGYAMLVVSFILFLFSPGSRFRELLKDKGGAALLLLLAAVPAAVRAGNPPAALPGDVAEAFSDLAMESGGRVCPVETYAVDFCRKISGGTSWRGMTAAQVLSGWAFEGDAWKNEPVIKTKGDVVRRLLGTDCPRAALSDFVTPEGEYKLGGALDEIYSGQDVKGRKDILAADEKINILDGVYTGRALKIFPVRGADGNVRWYSPADDLPQGPDREKRLAIARWAERLGESVRSGDRAGALETIAEIKKYQTAEASDALPSPARFRAERLYNRISSVTPWAMVCLSLGILSFVCAVVLTVTRRRQIRAARVTLVSAAILVWLFVTFSAFLRTWVSGHAALSNGFETMQALAWCSLLLTVVLRNKSAFMLPYGFIVSGLALLVAMMGQSNPALTSLTPVLNSPLLSLHVMVIMISYALLAFICLNGVAALILSAVKKDASDMVRNLRRTSEIMLYPAVFLLAAGIFTGAVWANVSWGRYWGWDAKEVWALITMMVYALPVHSGILGWFRNDLRFHVYAVLAFLTVLMTYFGANFFLAGLHSYA